MGGGSRKRDEGREEAVDPEDDPASQVTSAEQRRGDEGSSEQDADNSSKVAADGDQATPSAGSSKGQLKILLTIKIYTQRKSRRPSSPTRERCKAASSGE